MHHNILGNHFSECFLAVLFPEHNIYSSFRQRLDLHDCATTPAVRSVISIPRFIQHPTVSNTLAEICFTQILLCFDTTKPYLKQGVVDPSSQHGDCGNVSGEMSKGTQRVLKGEKGSMIILVISC